MARARKKGATVTTRNRLKDLFDAAKIQAALLDAVRSFLLVSISVALGLGIPILDLSGGDFRVIVSAGIASALQTIVKFLDPEQKEYGITN
jgi:hypothetical protein